MYVTTIIHQKQYQLGWPIFFFFFFNCDSCFLFGFVNLIPNLNNQTTVFEYTEKLCKQLTALVVIFFIFQYI